MIEIHAFECNMLQENCYVVSDETKECVVIDCGALYEEERQTILKYISAKELVPKHLIATHGHLDHNFGNGLIFDNYGLRVEVASADLELLNAAPIQASTLFGMQLREQLPEVGRLLSAGDTISFGNVVMKVITTPGHTEGSVTFYCESEKAAFTGDTLFRMSIGRTDLPGGDTNKMMSSLQLLAKLPADTKVYPGHGRQSCIADEVALNPFMRI